MAFCIAIGIVSADAEQCYDRIAHVFASLVYQAFGVFISAVIVMLASIQHMKFYLRTGLGKSTGFMTAVLGSIIQGLCLLVPFLSRCIKALDMVPISKLLFHANASVHPKIHVYLPTPKIQKALPLMRCALHRFSMSDTPTPTVVKPHHAIIAAVPNTP